MKLTFLLRISAPAVIGVGILFALAGCESRQSAGGADATESASSANERSASSDITDGRSASAGFSGEAITFPEIPVTAQDGRLYRFRSDVVSNHLLVINFNYTTCESICPVGNVVMQAIDQQARQALRRPVRLLSITIDPKNDTPERLRRASQDIGASDRWLWLTGTPADMGLLLSRFGARVVDIETHDPIFLIGDGRSGRFIRISGLPEPAQVLQHLVAFDT